MTSDPGATLWFTGLPGAGKSTVASELKAMLEAAGTRATVLDADELRRGLNADLGFSAGDRHENVRRLGEVALLIAGSGALAIVTAISPYATSRAAVRATHEIRGASFLEVYVATPLAICEARDPKGMYARARRGELAYFTGVSDPYEPPSAPELVLQTSGTPAEAAQEVLALLERAGRAGPPGDPSR